MAKALAISPFRPWWSWQSSWSSGDLAFKISLAPFHMWTPDVYEGAPTPVTAFLSMASKTAGFAAFVRLFWVGLAAPSVSTGLGWPFRGPGGGQHRPGQPGGHPQTNIKRMMAYSSIAQAGYISTGFLAGGHLGLTALLFYLFVYLFANLGAFLAIVLVSAKTGSDQIEDFAGLWKRSPLIGVTLLGVPLVPGGSAALRRIRGEVVPLQRRRFAGLYLAGFAGYDLQCRVPLLLPDGGQAGVSRGPQRLLSYSSQFAGKSDSRGLHLGHRGAGLLAHPPHAGGPSRRFFALLDPIFLVFLRNFAVNC